MEPYDELIQPISVCDRCLAITFGFTETRLGLPPAETNFRPGLSLKPRHHRGGYRENRPE